MSNNENDDNENDNIVNMSINENGVYEMRDGDIYNGNIYNNCNSHVEFSHIPINDFIDGMFMGLNVSKFINQVFNKIICHG